MSILIVGLIVLPPVVILLALCFVTRCLCKVGDMIEQGEE